MGQSDGATILTTFSTATNIPLLPFLSAAHSSASRPGALCAQRATHTCYFERRDGARTVLPGRLAHRHAPRRRWPRRGDRVSANCSTHAEKHVLASKPELKRMAAGLGRAEGPREAGFERCVGTIVFEEVGAASAEDRWCLVKRGEDAYAEDWKSRQENQSLMGTSTGAAPRPR